MGNSIFEKLIAKMKRNKDATEKEELQKLKDIKKAVRRAKSVEELEIVIKAIKDSKIMTEEEIERLKNKKKKKLQSKSFLDRIRVDNDTINRITQIGKEYKEKQRLREEKEQLQNRDERDFNTGGVKDKEKNKSRGERSRNSGGRTMGGR